MLDQNRLASRPGAPLDRLLAGQVVPFGGDRVAVVTDDLAASFAAGDRLVVVHETGDLLHVPRAEHEVVDRAVSAAVDAFAQLASATDDQLTEFFACFADLLADDEVFAEVATANDADVTTATARGRSTTRLALTPSMRAGMVDGLRVWQHTTTARDQLLSSHDHGTWTVDTQRAPLGVVGFVFEGRPNVFADATGVLRTGNTVVFRIGSDALGTARAIMRVAVEPALTRAGLPVGAVSLVDSPAHAAGWALFADRRLGLAVARGSGAAVAQLGAVARQHGVPASLHGTGGAWLVVAPGADADTVHQVVLHSLDRKVCNTLNVCCVIADIAPTMVPAVIEAAVAAAGRRDTEPVLHLDAAAAALTPHAHQPIDHDDLGIEWEWELAPELAIVVVQTVGDAVALFNRCSPRFAASLVGGDEALHQQFYDTVDAPFVGNGFTRWVDGQFAFDQPELGLSNWQYGRLFARGGVLSGDSVYTVRTRAHVRDHGVHR